MKCPDMLSVHSGPTGRRTVRSVHPSYKISLICNQVGLIHHSFVVRSQLKFQVLSGILGRLPSRMVSVMSGPDGPVSNNNLENRPGIPNLHIWLSILQTLSYHLYCSFSKLVYSEFFYQFSIFRRKFRIFENSRTREIFENF